MNVIRLNEPFEAFGYVRFPFADSKRTHFLGKISYHPVRGAIIEVRFPYYQKQSLDFLHESETVILGGVFDYNLFLFSAPCPVPSKQMIENDYRTSRSWIKWIRFHAEYLYLEDFIREDYKGNSVNNLDEIYKSSISPPSISKYLICFDEVHRNSKLLSTYFDGITLFQILDKASLIPGDEATGQTVVEFQKASLNNIACEVDDLEITIANSQSAHARPISHIGLCVNVATQNKFINISDIVGQAEKFRYLFILLLRRPINVKYIKLYKENSHSQISFLHNFKEIDYQNSIATGFSLDELNNNDDLKSYIEAWLFHVDNFVFETYVKPTLFERYDKRYDLYSKIILIYTRVEAIYKKCSNAKAKLYDVILGVFCCMQNDGLYSKLISAKVPSEIVKNMLVEYRNNIAHEATINLSDTYDYARFYDLLFVVFEYYILRVVLGVSKDRLHELYQYSVNFDLFFVKIKSCKQFFDV